MAEVIDTQAIKRSIRSYKGSLTTRINVAQNLVAIANGQDPLSSTTLTDLRDHKAAVENTYANIESQYRLLVEALPEEDEEEIDRLESDLDSETTRYNMIIRSLSAAISRAPVPVNHQPLVAWQAEDAPRTQRTVLDKFLTPKTLTKDDSPIRLARWMRSFKQWYEASRMDLSSISQQHAYFMSCLDDYLETRIQRRIRGDMPVFRENEEDESSCMDLLQAVFITRYPVIKRQFDFFNTCQQPGQLFSDWANDLREMGDQAHLHKITIDDIYVMRYICGTNDEKLREKFLMETHPTVEILNKIVDLHEMTINSVKAVNPYQVNAISQGQKQVPSVEELLKMGKCLKCGSKDHTAKECKIGNVKCRACDVAGHLERVCQRNNRKANAEYYSKKKKQNQVKVREVTDTTNDQQDTEFQANIVQVNAVISGPTMNIKIESGNSSFVVIALADTGCARTLLSADVAKRIGLPILQSKVGLAAANGSSMECVGQAPVTIRYKGSTVNTVVIITPDISGDALVGLKDLKDLKVVPQGLSMHHPQHKGVQGQQYQT